MTTENIKATETAKKYLEALLTSPGLYEKDDAGEPVPRMTRKARRATERYHRKVTGSEAEAEALDELLAQALDEVARIAPPRDSIFDPRLSWV